MGTISISKIESYLHSIIDNKVSDNTFVGTLPETTDSKWEDMCLIDAGNAIEELNAYGKGRILVFLYAKPLGGDKKNVSKLLSLEEKLDEVIENANKTNEDKYIINIREKYSDFDTTRKWHCNIIVLNILIY